METAPSQRIGAALAAPWLSSAAYLPVPCRFVVCGLVTALSLICSVPVRVPVFVGVKTTLTVHLDFAARLVEQVVAETAKSPVVEIKMLVSATLCLLESVNTLAGLLVPTFSVENVAVAGVSVAWTVPVPESGTLCGPLGALPLTVIAPVRAPTCVGVNVTLMTHRAHTASVLPQVV